MYRTGIGAQAILIWFLEPETEVFCIIIVNYLIPIFLRFLGLLVAPPPSTIIFQWWHIDFISYYQMLVKGMGYYCCHTLQCCNLQGVQRVEDYNIKGSREYVVETNCNDMHIGLPFVIIFFTYYSLVMGVWWSDWVDHMEIGIG
jgi:hypothetical protein